MVGRPGARRRARLSEGELDRQTGAPLPDREALSLIAPGGADGAATATTALPDGSAGEDALTEHAPMVRIQPVESEPL